MDRIREGERLLDVGRFEEALVCFAGVEAQDTRALFGCAVAHQMLGRFEEAERRYEKILSGDPQDEEALANRIAMNVERFDLERVERDSRRLLALNNQSMAALQGLLIVALERGDFETAAQYFWRIVPAARSDGDAVEYRLSRATVERLRSFHGATAHPY